MTNANNETSNFNENVRTSHPDYCKIYNFEESDKLINNGYESSPNIALLSLILLIGTCVIALTLKKLRRSVFFGAYVRIFLEININYKISTILYKN